MLQTDPARMEAQDHDGVMPVELLAELPGIEWILDSGRKISASRHPSVQFGFLNPLRPTPIALVASPELEWIFAQPEQALRESPALDPDVARLLILCAHCKPGPALLSVCKKNSISIANAPGEYSEILDYLQSNVSRMMAVRGIQHGVFLAVMNVGVLITGASGVGKSEVAMDLVQRGHQLIADDVVEIYRDEQGKLLGECPKSLRGYIEIRGLGIINILNMFGPASVLDSYQLALVIDLKDATNSEIRKVDRLSPSLREWEMLGATLPCLTMLVAPGRNLSVLVEAAVRDHLLRISGVDSSAEFVASHGKMIQNSSQRNG